MPLLVVTEGRQRVIDLQREDPFLKPIIDHLQNPEGMAPRKTAENDWEVENRRGRRDIVNISRLKPYHSRAESAPAEGEATQPASPVHARDAQAPNGARSDAGDAKDDSDDEEFHDALDKPPEDATMPARPRRSVMPHQRDDFVYY
ncbi:hypothetical protein MTO96_046725 [Rhipicephalus appendiculatus]